MLVWEDDVKPPRRSRRIAPILAAGTALTAIRTQAFEPRVPRRRLRSQPAASLAAASASVTALRPAGGCPRPPRGHASPRSDARTRRVNAADKRIINGQTDVNQLVPFKYKWAWEKYLATCANHWMPQEVNMSRDIATWKDPNGLTEDERRIIKRNLGFFVTADSLAANNIVLGTYRHITAPECRQFLLRQAFEEAIHTHAYQYIVESLGLDESEIFNAYHEVASIRDKDEFLIPFIDAIMDPHFHTGTPENRPDAAEEPDRLRLPDGRPVLLRRLHADPGAGPPEQDDRRGRAVPVHPARRVDALQLRHRPHQPDQAREPAPVDAGLQGRDQGAVREGVELEYRYAEDTMPRGVLGMNASMFKGYLRYIANRRATQIGLEALFPNEENPFPWMSEMIDLKKERNFFETRVIDYQTGGALSWD
jgi:ribonucleoside-diphosphate reductase beta chain